MKKLNLVAIFATVALAITGLAGCTSEYDNVDYLDALRPLYIVGDMTAEVNVDTSKYPVTNNGGPGNDFAALDWSSGEGVFTFTYKNTMNAWGGGKGKMSFKVVDVAGWTLPSYGLSSDNKGTVKIDGDYAGLLQASNPDNIIVEGFEEGEQYTIYVKGTKTKALIKVIKG